MQHVNHPAHGTSHPMPAKTLRLAFAFASALFVVGCGSSNEGNTASGEPPAKTAAVVSSAKVAKSLEDTPCKLLSKEALGAAFDVPAEKIEQSEMLSMCSFRWHGDDRQLDVSINIQRIDSDTRLVASYFDSATRGMTGAEVDRAFDQISEQVKKDKDTLDTPEKRKAAEMIVGSGKSSGARGFQFEDVDGIADQARVETASGTLNVRQGNLYFSVGAYVGAPMPMPSELTATGMLQASKDWRMETAPQHRETAIKVAQLIVKQL